MKPFQIKTADLTADSFRMRAIPFGGPLPGGPAGKDTDGEYFSQNTDLCLDWYPERIPLLYHHGHDDTIESTVIGYVDRTSAKMEDDGWWVRIQLNASHKYHAKIKELIDKSVLYGSSGAYPTLVKVAKSGEILRWPWVEQSTTPTPANLFSIITPDDIAKHYKSAGLDFAPLQAKIEAESAANSAPSDVPDEKNDETRPPERAEKITDSETGMASFEDLIEEITTAINGGMFGQSVPWLPATGYARVLATYPDHALVKYSSYEPGEEPEQYYNLAYSVDDEGALRLGDVTPMEQTYVPKKSTSERFETAPLQVAHASAIKFAHIALARTKDVLQRRVSEGRKLSDGHRSALKALLEDQKANVSALEDLLTATAAPVKAEADRLRILEARLRNHRMNKETPL